MGELDQKLAILSHASSDLAYPLAAALAHAGARLACVDGDLNAADQLAAQLRGEGAQATAYAAQLSEGSVRAALDVIVSAQGHPDILVMCPPTPVVAPSATLDEADFRAALERSLIHAFLWCQAAGRVMLDVGRGVIVNVTGLSGMGGWPGWLAQSAAFAGIHNLTHTLAVEWAKQGLRVNGLVPGITESAVQQLVTSPGAPDEAKVIRRIPAGRAASGEDLGQALLYLVRSTFVTGEILRVDGGWDMWGRLYAVAPKRE